MKKLKLDFKKDSKIIKKVISQFAEAGMIFVDEDNEIINFIRGVLFISKNKWMLSIDFCDFCDHEDVNAYLQILSDLNKKGINPEIGIGHISVFDEETGEYINMLSRFDVFEYMDKYKVCYCDACAILEGRMIDAFRTPKKENNKVIPLFKEIN